MAVAIPIMMVAGAAISGAAVLLFLLLLVVSFLQFRVLERRVHYGD